MSQCVGDGRKKDLRPYRQESAPRDLRDRKGGLLVIERVC